MACPPLLLQSVDPACSAAKGYNPCVSPYLADKLRAVIRQLPANQTIIEVVANEGVYGRPGYRIPSGQGQQQAHSTDTAAAFQQPDSASLRRWMLPVVIGVVSGG
jgi:hypothetical protein